MAKAQQRAQDDWWAQQPATFNAKDAENFTQRNADMFYTPAPEESVYDEDSERVVKPENTKKRKPYVWQPTHHTLTKCQ